MPFVLLDSQFEEGLQRQSALLLTALRWVAAISPFTIPNVRAALETDQNDTFEDAEFDKFLTELYSLDVDFDELDPAEINVLNELRAYLDPLPNFACCGSDAPSALNTSQLFTLRLGSGTYEHEIRRILDPEVTCDVKTIEVTITPSGGAPAPTVNPVVLNTLGCESGKQPFAYLWLDFVGDPSGESYDFLYDFLDEFGSSIVVIPDSITL